MIQRYYVWKYRRQMRKKLEVVYPRSIIECDPMKIIVEHLVHQLAHLRCQIWRYRIEGRPVHEAWSKKIP